MQIEILIVVTSDRVFDLILIDNLQIFLLFFLTLCIMSWTVIGIFIRRKDKDDVDSSRSHSHLPFNSTTPPPPLPADDDESIVYRIW